MKALTQAAWVLIHLHLFVTPQLHARVMREIILPTVQGMAKMAFPTQDFYTRA
jgi:hypothetical protein